MEPLSKLDCSNLAGVLTDIDDTLTTDAKLLPDAFDALWRLSQAGLAVIPITGRSAGWAHMVLKTWPVAAVVAESGGLYLFRNVRENRIKIGLHAPPEQVRADRLALQACGEQIMTKIPGLACASDNPFRQVDYALDYCEEVTRVSADDVAQAIAMFKSAGFSARASSVHINAWRGQFDKGPMTQRLLDDHFSSPAGGHNPGEIKAGSKAVHKVEGNNRPERWIFIGDAPNDASMFAMFPRSVGVANILSSIDQLPVKPAYMTKHKSGAGFVELAEHILKTKGA